jgi:15-cis-phytoene synthase
MSPALRLACAYAPRRWRTVIAAGLAFDERLGTILSRTSEPIAAQMRLAWWRDWLNNRNVPMVADPLAHALALHWGDESESLVALVDGWEALVGDSPLPRAAFAEHCQGRGELFAAIARLTGNERAAVVASAHGHRFALGDLLGRLSDERESAMVRALAGKEGGKALPLPRALRPLVILSGLGARVIASGGGPLLGNLASMLAAMKLGLFGRLAIVERGETR